MRFRSSENPIAAIATYLQEVAKEADKRRYSFDSSKIEKCKPSPKIEETDGQLLYEWQHLKDKLAVRNPAKLKEIQGIEIPDSHPLFRIVPGAIRDWEKL